MRYDVGMNGICSGAMSEIENCDQLFFTYIVKCADQTLYTGWTNNLAKRITAHNAGKGARYTRSRLPVELLASWSFSSKREAMQMEHKLKELTRSQKLLLISQIVNSCSSAPDKLHDRETV